VSFATETEILSFFLQTAAGEPRRLKFHLRQTLPLEAHLRIQVRGSPLESDLVERLPDEAVIDSLHKGAWAFTQNTQRTV
jgi:hypothetical protein